MDRFAHRKGTRQINLKHPDGTPVAATEVSFRQKGHSFLFGCGAFDVVRIMETKDPEQLRFLNERMDKWQRLFNYGTLPFYWGQYEPTEGQTREAAVFKAAQWLNERGITVKGHPLCWHTACADWLLQYSNDVILEKQLARIDREVTGFRGQIDMWDVINEVVIMPNFDKYDNAITRLCRSMGRVSLVRSVFNEARKANPNATLLINDFDTSVAYEVLIDALLDAGVPIDVIGIQSHQHQGYWGMEKLHRVLDRFSRFGLPIHFTENTLISGDLMPPEYDDLNDYQIPVWPSTPEGEERQAREICEMYTELFAHPLVQAITTWDPVDGCWLGAPSGFMYADNTIKPSYTALEDLIHNQWSTRETLVTDDNGSVNLTGFYGRYEVTVHGVTQEWKLDKDPETTVSELVFD